MVRFSIPVKGKAFITAVAVATGTFLALGTVTALWENPLFIRMVPAGTAEISLLAAQSILLGLSIFPFPVASVRQGRSGLGAF